ncbi:MAG TPA: hypothetical protein VGA37_03745 [Gemmatimonadales bacterium]
MRTYRSFSAIAVLVLAAAACDDNRASVFGPIGDPSYDFNIAPVGAIPGGAVSLNGAGDSATLTLTGLRDLAGSASYQLWAVSRDVDGRDVIMPLTGSIVEFFSRADIDPVTGDTVRDAVTGDPLFVGDSNVVSATATGSYGGPVTRAVNPITSVRIIAESGDTLAPVGGANAVVMSIESTGGAAAPSAAQFLWRRVGPGGSGALTFGTFGGTDVISTSSPDDYVYPIIGAGRAGVRGDEFSADMQRMGRPPVGFMYRGYLVDVDGVGTEVDILRSGHSGVTEESRVDLTDADINILLPGVSDVAIFSGQVRNCLQGSGVANCANTLVAPTVADTTVNEDKPFGVFRQFVLALEPKTGASGFAPATVRYTGDIAEVVWK